MVMGKMGKWEMVMHGGGDDKHEGMEDGCGE